MNRAITCVLIAPMLLISPTAPIAGPTAALARPTQEDTPFGAQLPSSSRTPLLSKVEQSIERGVKYLLAQQNADGSFGDEKASPDVRVGETALSTLALLSCGESHQS